MPRLLDLFLYFLKLGCLGFGGPLALIGQMQREIVNEARTSRQWLSEEEFRQSFALIKSMPGTVATQMAVYIGRRNGGFWGGVVAGIGLVLPAFFLMTAIAATYSEFQSIPIAQHALQGIQMAALALIFYSLKGMTSIYWKKFRFWALLLLGVLTFSQLAFPEALLIFMFGFISVAMDGHFVFPRRKLSSFVLLPWAFPVFLSLFTLVPFLAMAQVIPVEQMSLGDILTTLSGVCLKAGAFVFGSGFAIIPFLQRDFVTNLQWISVSEFTDALAFGQMTPGPVVISVTFIGYKVAGLAGATVATIAILLPSFIHQLTWFPHFMRKLSRQAWLTSFLIGAIAAVAAGILFVLAEMLRGISVPQAVLFTACVVLTFRTKVPAWLLIIAAGAVSVAVS